MEGMIAAVVSFFVALVLILTGIFAFFSVLGLFFFTVNKIGEWTGCPEGDRDAIAFVLVAIICLAFIISGPVHHSLYGKKVTPAKISVEAE